MASLDLQNIQLKNLINRCKDNSVLKGQLYSGTLSDNDIALSLKAFSHTFAVAVPQFSLFVPKSITDKVEIDSLDDALKAALFELAFKDYIKKAGEIIESNIVVDGYLKGSDLNDYASKMSFSLNTDNGTCDFILCGKSPDAFAALYERIKDNCALESAQAGSSSALIRCAFVTGYSTFSVQMLKELAAGDAIIIENSFINTDNMLLAALEHAFLGTVSDRKLYIKGIYNMTDTTQENINEANTEERPLVSLGDIKVKVCFEVGSRYMSIDELNSLKDGSVLNLDDTSLDNVKLTVNNQIIGTGRIVEIGDKYAFEIASISKSE